MLRRKLRKPDAGTLRKTCSRRRRKTFLLRAAAGGIGALKAQEITEAASDAWILLEHVTGIDRTHYFLKMTESCPKEAAESYRELIGRRAQHMPVQYLTGEQDFYGVFFPRE